MAQQWVSVQSHPHPHLPGSPKAPTPSGPATPPSGAVPWNIVGDPGTLTAMLPVAGGSPVYNDYQYPDANLANDSDANQHYAVGSSGIFSIFNSVVPHGHHLEQDVTAPFPGTVMRWQYPGTVTSPPNGTGPGSPGTLMYQSFSRQELFGGMIFKLDAGFPGFSNRKLMYFWDSGTAHIIVVWQGNRPGIEGTSEPSFQDPPVTNNIIFAGDANSGSGTTNPGDVGTGDWWMFGLYAKIHTQSSPYNGICKLTIAKCLGGNTWDTPILCINRTDIQWGGTDFGEFHEYHGISGNGNDTATDYNEWSNIITLKGA